MEENKKHKVYVYTCKDNGKMYVGQTSTTIEERAKRNGLNYRECSYFWNAICAHGWENFECRILQDGLTQEEANYWEEYYIKKFNTTDRNTGYNLTYGGDGNVPTEQAKQNMKKNHANVVGENHPNAKQIFLLNTGEVFGSSLEASQKYNVDRGSIRQNCRGETQYAGASIDGIPLQWCYFKDSDKRKFDSNLKIHGGQLYRKQIYCLTTQEHFNSVSDAAKKYNIAESSIRKNIAQERKYAGVLDDGRTLQWCNFNDKDLYEYNPYIKPTNANTIRPVYCYELNMVFINSADAERQTHINAGHIRRVCNNKKGHYTAGGMNWCWAD